MLPPWVTTSSKFILLQHRSVRFVAEYQVVEHPYAEKFARLQQPLRDIDIVVAGVEDTAGVIVRYDDRCGAFSERIREHFPKIVENGTINISMLKNYLIYTGSLNVSN